MKLKRPDPIPVICTYQTDSLRQDHPNIPITTHPTTTTTNTHITLQPACPNTLTPPFPFTPTPHVAFPFATSAPKYVAVTVLVGTTPLPLPLPLPLPSPPPPPLLLVLPPNLLLKLPITPSPHALTPPVAVEQTPKSNVGVGLPGGTDGCTGKTSEVSNVDEEVDVAVAARAERSICVLAVQGMADVPETSWV